MKKKSAFTRVFHQNQWSFPAGQFMKIMLNIEHLFAYLLQRSSIGTCYWAVQKTAVTVLAVSYFPLVAAQVSTKHNLTFPDLATRWDEGIPLGNGMLGALIWKKEAKLRLSLDRADLWDERKALPDLRIYNFEWVAQQRQQDTYKEVHRRLDDPYDQDSYPTKLPAGAMEFDIAAFGNIVSSQLDLQTATHTLIFENGVVFRCFIHANRNEGYFTFENLKGTRIKPQLKAHNYAITDELKDDINGHGGAELHKLGYKKGNVISQPQTIHYRQPTYETNYYEILIDWIEDTNKLSGRWTVTNNRIARLKHISTKKMRKVYNGHRLWWVAFWRQSAINVPDKLIEKQYYLEQYKFGSVARKGAPAITLQAVWTADNGSLPPWKGDFHNDLNTQLSYWPAYSSNHLKEAETFTDWLGKIKKENRRYTQDFFGVEGLNVPGVTTLNGHPLGGWIQYSMSPTISAWCAQYFYWQWKYSMDKKFLDEKAYPYLSESARFLENISYIESGLLKIPLSSSPEYYDNNKQAWFDHWTNFDLSLAKFLFKAAAEVSLAKGLQAEYEHWIARHRQLPKLDADSTGLTVAPNTAQKSSHRHLSPYMAIYPLALLDINEAKDAVLIQRSLRHLEKLGTRAWCGYSFSWMASLYARAYEADKAVKQLQIFASNFCSPNSFHLNGDQKGGQYSDFQYRPFTLEGNLAFAQGVNELLLQSRSDYIQVFPAVPDDWKDVSFTNLRAEGAFLLSAKKVDGGNEEVTVYAEKGGLINLRLPFEISRATSTSKKGVRKPVTKQGSFFSARLEKGETIVLQR